MADRADCTVRAIALVTGTPYTTVFETLKQAGRRNGCGFNVQRWIACQCRPALGEPEYIFGWDTKYIPLPVTKGSKRHTAETFTITYPLGRYLIVQANHVSAVIDGAVVMETRHATACVYCAWEFIKRV